jgi:hypothetical protein
LTVPLPVPELPALTVIQGALLAAVHPHVFVVVTETLYAPPVAGADCAVGVAVNEHAAAA